MSGSILIIDDDKDVLQAAKLFLKRHFSKVDTEKDPHSMLNLLRNHSYDVVLLDMNFTEDVTSGEEGFKWLKEIKTFDSSIAVILITGYGDIDKAVKAVKAGATDFVLKPWDNQKLLATIYSAIKLSASKKEILELKQQQKELSREYDKYYQDVIGRSDAMLSVLSTIEKVAKTDANILILGENGTGKEVIARALHRRSNRNERMFVPVDLGSITETLFESELFGHVRGAFTDAKEDRTGRFELANGGTLFLDEIGNVPLNLQSKLLTAIQSKSIIKVGGTQAKKVDIRLITATNTSLIEAVDAGSFRQDLLYRINTIQIELPPLRDRKEDIEELTHYFILRYSKKYRKNIKTINREGIKALHAYHWPGNVRELQHAIERAVIMTDEETIGEQDLMLIKDRGESESIDFENLNLEEIEKMVLRKALTKHNGNISKTSEELGITRASLYRRLDKFGL
ncbi:MAG: sigma-54 dependent transcriptional regulator [Bacteroidota bacterium]